MHTHMSIWDKRQAACSPATAMPACQRHLPLFHRRRDQARQARSTPSPTRPPTATSGWCRASRRRCCWPIRRATARPRAASPTARARRPSASSSASPTRWPTPISLCGAADGRPRRDPEQDPSRRADGQEPLRPAAGRAGRSADRVRLACARRSSRSEADHDFLLKGDVFIEGPDRRLHASSSGKR